jgi:hypothetical protein
LDRAEKRYPKAVSFNPEWTPEGHKGERYRWIENASHGLRDKGPVHEIARSEGWHSRHWHTLGYYIDTFQSETTVPTVLQIPGRDGKPCYVPANSDACNEDCFVADFHSVTDDLQDACQNAMNMAESYADDAREACAKYQAAHRVEELDEEIKEERASLLALIQELRANCDRLTGLSAVRATIREHIQSVRDRCEELAEERDRIKADGYLWD